MTVQIDQIFTAKAENIQTFLSTAGQGCYVPAYQRAYAWDSGNVERLFEDVINGLNHLMMRTDAIGFLGTLIAIHDTDYVTVKPVFRSEVASKVMTIIDGQQRISTSVMINIALHAQIRTLLARIGDVAGEHFDWIRDQAAQAAWDLYQTFVLRQATGTPKIYGNYPRVIRAMDDVWSKRQDQAVYKSPIAALIWAYIEHVEGQKTDAFKHRVHGSDGKPDPRHQPVIEVFGYVVRQLNDIARAPEKYDFPEVQQLISKPDYIQSLWAYPASDAVLKFVLEHSDDKKFYPSYVQLLRTLIFFKYFCTRMALTVVTTRTEDDAFDMFEALNTTGAPLTAYETFRPKVIEAETLEQYQASPSHIALTRIDRYLEAFKKADERQRATAEMLIPFALAETGEKLQKNLSDQRRYLRDAFDKLPDINAKRDTVQSMANLAAFLETGWARPLEETPVIEGLAALDEETGFAFQALRNLKHNIVIAALSRFYDELRRAAPEDVDVKARDFIGAIKATTAFSMLWRGSKGATENIDALYRAIMRDGLGAPEAIPPLAKRIDDKSGVKIGAVSLTNYRRLLRRNFASEYPDKDAWVKAASRTPIYKHSTVVAKFLLLAASHDSAPDDKNPGLIIHGKKGLAPTMRTEAWRSDVNISVEHVAPQSRSNGWDGKIYEPGQEAFDRLGNLTLLPIAENSYVSNRPWAHKRLLYRYFSAATQAEADTVAAQFGSAGLSVSESGNVILANSSYMPMCRSVSALGTDWDLATVELRSANLAGLAYDNLISWFGQDDSTTT